MRNTLDALEAGLFWRVSLVDKQTGTHLSGVLQKYYIVLSIRLKQPTRNEKGDTILLSLPSDIGSGQAGYKDGQFVFSEDYYLKLKVVDEKALTGDGSKFAIEKDN